MEEYKEEFKAEYMKEYKEECKAEYMEEYKEEFKAEYMEEYKEDPPELTPSKTTRASPPELQEKANKKRKWSADNDNAPESPPKKVQVGATRRSDHDIPW